MSTHVITATLTEEEALAFARVIRGLCPPGDIAHAWYSALDKISPQLPDRARYLIER